MTKGIFPTDRFNGLRTPFYYYDIELLRQTLNVVVDRTARYGYHEHYAVKANANPRILSLIARQGLGADCVSGGEVQAAVDAGFPPDRIFFAGVGKADWEILLGLEHDIACFNVESLAELHVINDLAAAQGKTASVALRINPNIDAHTHAKITTGLQENKFGITAGMLPGVLNAMTGMKHVRFFGIHFHIGSQITDMSVFRDLCIRAGEWQDELEARGLTVENLNFGGGLGIDYHHPNQAPVPDFENFFSVFHQLIRQRPGQQIHFELGRAVVGQCGTLIAKTLYVKEGEAKKFAILDAGFTELIRPAMYDAYHRIENLTSDEAVETYDVAGPICESSDVFAKARELNRVHRNDLIAIRSAGAYGEVMASQYNCRRLPDACFSDLL
ncbi:MAG: diaminopimelate decarboxylase [Tannerella sp.]|jgi:diaminopimelate decarboxylase|nr:diaminopimelate decarboxylase [Tannerella sp.]